MNFFHRRCLLQDNQINDEEEFLTKQFLQINEVRIELEYHTFVIPNEIMNLLSINGCLTVSGERLKRSLQWIDQLITSTSTINFNITK